MSKPVNTRSKRNAIINIGLGLIVVALNLVAVADFTLKNYVGIGVGVMFLLLGTSMLRSR